MRDLAEIVAALRGERPLRAPIAGHARLLRAAPVDMAEVDPTGVDPTGVDPTAGLIPPGLIPPG